MTVVSLFAGCGGLDLGFERAGFKVIWANEFDSTIHKTYQINHPNTILNTADIRTISGVDVPDCDGIIGGPPCQSWSEGGKQRGIEDPRGQLFFDYIRIVSEKKPKFFVIENVQGILEEKHKSSLNIFITNLRNAGYNVTYELLNAADYRVPQDRFRVFFVGIRNDLHNKFVFPDSINSQRITLRQAIGDITEEPRLYYKENVKSDNYLRQNHDVYTGPYDSKYMARNRVRGWDEVSFTMQAQARNAPQHPQAPKMGFISSSQRCFIKGSEHLYRRLSVRECARIQTFPDNFKFIYSDVVDGYKMVGNAVPPRLAWYLAIQMKKAFSNEMSITSNENEAIKASIIKQIPVYNITERCSFTVRSNIRVSPIDSKVELIEEIIGGELDKHVLIGFVKDENTYQFINHTAKIYYTGKQFPLCISLNKLFYFMPYIKGKGIKDLYFIKIARVGTKREICPESNDTDNRIVFEIKYVRPLFKRYIPIHLNIWRTFTDTTLRELVKLNEYDGFI